MLRTDKKSKEFVPLLAADMPKVSSDLLKYTYELNDNAKFSGGKKVTANDVVFSMKLVKNPFVNNHQKRDHYEDILDVKALDDRTVEFTLAVKSPQGVRITSDFAILSEEYFDPKHALKIVTFKELQHSDRISSGSQQLLKGIAEKVNTFGSTAASFDPAATCGPYVLSGWERNKEIVLQANAKFWGLKLDKVPNQFFKQNVLEIRFLIISDEAKIRSTIFNNTLDVVADVPPKLYYELSEIPRLQDKFEFYTPPQASYEYIGLNIKGDQKGRSPVFKEVEVRKAMAYLVDYDLLVEKVRNGLAKRISAEYPIFMPEYENKDLPLVNFDIDKAKQILASAGWKDTDDNGVLDKEINGERVQLIADCIYNSNKPYRAFIAEEVQKACMQAGILIAIHELDWKDYLAKLKSGDFDLAIGAWSPDPNENTYSQVWHSKNWGTGSNFVGFGDSESDNLIELYDETVGLENRKAISMKIQKKIYDAHPYIFLWINTQSLVVANKFENAPVYDIRPGFWIGEWE